MRRDYGFQKNWKLVVGFLLILNLFACGNAQRAKEAMQLALKTQSENKQIVEFFMYTCPHCKAVEPAIKDWQAKQALLFQHGIYSFEQVPAVFSANWARDAKVGEPEAAIYYTFKRMGVEPQLRLKLFEAIQNKSLEAAEPESVSRFLKQVGVSLAEFRSTYTSDLVRADVARAEQLTRQYAVYAVPAFILFNRSVLMPQDYSDHQVFQAALMEQVKLHYQSKLTPIAAKLTPGMQMNP